MDDAGAMRLGQRRRYLNADVDRLRGVDRANRLRECSLGDRHEVVANSVPASQPHLISEQQLTDDERPPRIPASLSPPSCSVTSTSARRCFVVSTISPCSDSIRLSRNHSNRRSSR